MIDNRAGMGIPDDMVNQVGLPVGANRGMFEAKIIQCSHCQQGLIVNPLRTRERAYCSKCDHYICDKCKAVAVATGECKTFKQLADEVQESAFLAEQAGIILST